MYKVLIVEDEDIIRKGPAVHGKLAGGGLCGGGRGSGRTGGTGKIRETNPDIVVVDINMPVKDGLSMLEDSIEEYGYDAVIVSGYSDFEYARKAIRLGVTEYLLKPVNFNELYDALRKIKDKQQAAARLRHELKQLDMEKRKLGILDEPETGDSPEGNRHVEYMMDCIRNHYSSHLSLTDISEQCGMSCTYLNSKFKSFTGYTFNDYLNRYRMQKAVDLLKENKIQGLRNRRPCGLLGL